MPGNFLSFHINALSLLNISKVLLNQASPKRERPAAWEQATCLPSAVSYLSSVHPLLSNIYRPHAFMHASPALACAATRP